MLIALLPAACVQAVCGYLKRSVKSAIRGNHGMSIAVARIVIIRMNVHEQIDRCNSLSLSCVLWKFGMPHYESIVTYLGMHQN
jgi:hypothetical protein